VRRAGFHQLEPALQGGVKLFGGRHDFINQAHALSFFGADRRAGEDHPPRLRIADDLA